jgi:pyruvate/2-oxoglutarate dehydrogenase complex dihydrolipoamide acyltransferase (E2) component
VAESLLRPFTRWLFRYPPYSPYVTINVEVDFMLTALIGRLYTEFPAANAHVIGRRHFKHRHVNVGLPVDMLGHKGGSELEVGVVVVEQTERLSVRQIAARTRKTVAAERDGKSQLGIVKVLLPIARRSPEWLMEGVLDGLDRLSRSWALSPLTHRALPISMAITNPGSVVGNVPGGRFVSASMVPPNRVLSIGSLLGVAGVRDQVLAVDGEAKIRPTLPMIYIFDHRLFDGVVASRMLMRFAEMMSDPSAILGADGTSEG